MKPEDIFNALDERTEGALYALQHTAKGKNLEPHVWASSTKNGVTTFLFFATDRNGRTMYFDYASSKDTEKLGDKVKNFAAAVEIQKAKARKSLETARLADGVDPDPEVDTKNLN
jgi:hypothetical protein